MWTAENDSNTPRVGAKIFVSAKKYLPQKKFPDTCGHGLRDLPKPSFKAGVKIELLSLLDKENAFLQIHEIFPIIN